MSKLPTDLARFQWEWDNGLRTRAIDLAKEYINANYDALSPHLLGKTVPELVAMIDAYRAEGREDDRVVVDMWLLSGCAASVSVLGRIDLPAAEPASFFENTVDVERLAWIRRKASTAEARKYAQELVATKHDELAVLFQRYTLEELVKLVDTYRDSDQPINAAVVDAWVSAEYGPQKINGSFDTVGIAKGIAKAFGG